MTFITRERVTMNVAGLLFETFEDTLQCYPETLLGNNEKRSVYYCSNTKQYFFDRSRTCFQYILQFYQTKGTLKCPPTEEPETFEAECRYFELPCEAIRKMLFDEGIIIEVEDQQLSGSKKFSFRSKVWSLLDQPATSRYAWCFAIFSMLMICVSISNTCFETLLDVYHDVCFDVIMCRENVSLLEFVLNIWFLTEFILRLQFSENKITFFCLPMTWVDMLAVLPYFVFIHFVSHTNSYNGIFDTLKVIKVIRLFHFTKLSCPLKIMGNTLQLNSVRMGLLLSY